jgi:hypothetical protein
MNDLPMIWAVLAGVILVVILVRRFGRGATIAKAASASTSKAIYAGSATATVGWWTD